MKLADTTISVWQERDNLHICLTCLSSKRKGQRTLVEWIDDAAREAIDDGYLDAKESILGNLGRFVRQQGRLHVSAFRYWQDVLGSPKKPVSIHAEEQEEEQEEEEEQD